jgi:PEP-CTERM motif
MKKLGIILSLVVVLLSSQTARGSVIVHFEQKGYSGGGVVSGSFSGNDLNGDGLLSSLDGELVNYSMSFSGDSIVANFTHDNSIFNALIYSVGSSHLGNLGVEGVLSDVFGVTGYYYMSGIAVTGTYGGSVIDLVSGATSSTPELISVTPAVPEPSTYALVVMGLGVLGFARKKMMKNEG